MTTDNRQVISCLERVCTEGPNSYLYVVLMISADSLIFSFRTSAANFLPASTTSGGKPASKNGQFQHFCHPESRMLSLRNQCISHFYAKTSVSNTEISRHNQLPGQLKLSQIQLIISVVGQRSLTLGTLCVVTSNFQHSCAPKSGMHVNLEKQHTQQRCSDSTKVNREVLTLCPQTFHHWSAALGSLFVTREEWTVTSQGDRHSLSLPVRMQPDRMKRWKPLFCVVRERFTFPDWKKCFNFFFQVFHTLDSGDSLCPGGVSVTAWASAISTDCSASPMRSLPLRDRIRYRASACRHATNIPLIFSIFFAPDYNDKFVTSLRQVRGVGYWVFIPKAQEQSQPALKWFLSFRVSGYIEHTFCRDCKAHLRRHSTEGSEMCLVHTAPPVMAAISLSFANTPDTVSLGGANIVLCVLRLACSDAKSAK